MVERSTRKRKSPIDGVEWVQLATRIPRELQRRSKFHALKYNTTIMELVIQALEEKLDKGKKPKKKEAA